jgi:hypothetical protein
MISWDDKRYFSLFKMKLPVYHDRQLRFVLSCLVFAVHFYLSQ